MAIKEMITKLTSKGLAVVAGIVLSYVVLANSVFYAEPGFVYHVRTILG